MINSSITFPQTAPALKITRSSDEKWAASLEEERRRLQEDHDALREREANLREYEVRLRALQKEIEASRTGTASPHQTTPALFQRPLSQGPFVDDPALHAAWEKLHRAREILETEQSHLREDRVLIRDQMETIKRKEASLLEREAKVAEREELIVAAVRGSAEAAAESSLSTMSRFTTAPFTLARAVFRRRKDD
jgi:DNA repair exonuclease SbcCD ATPase subunit